MKKVLTLAIIAIFVFSGHVFAQKTGHINLNDLLLLMPERKKAEEEIQNYAKELDAKLRSMSQEYELKIQEYQSKEASMSELVKSDKQKEIANLEDRIKDFQSSAQESLQKKQNDLLEPMIEKAKKAIEEVSKEAGYRNVIDSSMGVLLYSSADDDLLPLVKKKLNLISTAAPANTKPAGK